MSKWLRCDKCRTVYFVLVGEGDLSPKAICPNCGLLESISNFVKHRVSCFWHMTHKDNINNIITHGILNHDDARKFKVQLVDISDPDAQRWRECLEPFSKRRIHDYAPLYINPRNPMLSVRRNIQDDLCLLEVSLTVLKENEYLFTDGNAASRDTRFFSSFDDIESLPWDVLLANYWADFPDGKRKRCAEILVYPKVPPKYIDTIHCYSKDTAKYLSGCGRDVKQSINYFFERK